MNATKSEKRQKQTSSCKLGNKLTPLERSVLFTGRTQRRRCFYKRTCVRVEFLHLWEQTKIKLFTDLSGIRFVCGVLCKRTIWANYRRTIGELCGTNWIDELHLYKEYKGLLGVNYANRAHLVSVGKLGWGTMGRAELSAKSKHNIKSFSKFKELPSLEVTRTDE